MLGCFAAAWCVCAACVRLIAATASRECYRVCADYTVYIYGDFMFTCSIQCGALQNAGASELIYIKELKSRCCARFTSLLKSYIYIQSFI